MKTVIEAQPMTTRPGWNYETRTCLYQLWPPGASTTEPHRWSAAWTEQRERPVGYYLDDYDDDWRPACDFGRGDTPDEALNVFPSSAEAEEARRALLRAARA